MSERPPSDAPDDRPDGLGPDAHDHDAHDRAAHDRAAEDRAARERDALHHDTPYGAIAITVFLAATILVFWFGMFTLNLMRS